MECKKCGKETENDFCEDCKKGDSNLLEKFKIEGFFTKKMYKPLIPVVGFIVLCWLTIAVFAVGNEFDAIVGTWVDEGSGKSITFNYDGYGEGTVTADFSEENEYRYMSSDKLTLLILREKNLTKSIGLRGSLKIRGNKMTWTPDVIVRPYLGEAEVDRHRKTWSQPENDYSMSDTDVKQWKWQEIDTQDADYLKSIFTEYSIGQTVVFKKQQDSVYGSWKGAELKNSAVTLTFNPNGTFTRITNDSEEKGTFTENEGKLTLTEIPTDGNTPPESITFDYSFSSKGNNLTLKSSDDKMLFKRK